MKKIITLTIASLLLVSCNAPKNETESNSDTKIEIQSQDNQNNENNQEQAQERPNRQYELVEIYQNGEKYEVQVLPHGDHYHVIFDGVDYAVSEEEYQMIQKEDNQFLLGVGLRTQMPTIVSYTQHGDHWHVKYSDGTEDVLFEDPAKIIEEQKNSEK